MLTKDNKSYRIVIFGIKKLIRNATEASSQIEKSGSILTTSMPCIHVHEYVENNSHFQSHLFRYLKNNIQSHQYFLTIISNSIQKKPSFIVQEHQWWPTKSIYGHSRSRFDQRKSMPKWGARLIVPDLLIQSHVYSECGR